jgi:PAS domain S-box-containing protein
MHPPNLHLVIVLFLSGILCLGVVTILWRKSPQPPGAKAMIVWLFGLAWWDITYAIFWANAPSPVPYFWLDITLVGAYIVPVAVLVFAIDFTQCQWKFRRMTILALCVEPIFVFIMQWTDVWHHLYFGGSRMLNTTSIFHAGPVWWLNLYYSYTILLIAVGIHVVRFFRTKGLYRKQLLLILSAILLPWIAHIFAVAGLGVVWQFDTTPLLFTVTVLSIAYGIFRYHLLDLMPIAHNLLLENMSDGVIVLDLHDRIVDVNHACEAWLGRSLDSVHGEMIKHVLQRWPILVDEFNNADGARREILIDESTYSWLDVRISPLLDRRNEKVGSLVIGRDISQSKQVQRDLQAAHDELEKRVRERTAQLREANLSLEKALKVKDEFLAAVSHELRTPLTSILGMAELLQVPKYGTLSEKQHRATITIENSGQRLLELIDDVLDYTKLQGSEFLLDLQPCSLGSLCQSVLQSISIQTGKKRQQTHLSVVPEEIMIRTDPTQLQKLLHHLLGNASKFTPDEGQVGIQVEGDANARRVSIIVWDTGIGIPEQDLPHLFQLFVQIDARLARQYEGIGLGLTLARQRAELLGGNIGVESTPGKGSRFMITIPWID